MRLADELKTTLADAVVLYLRAHGYHWNVEGPDFHEYHGLFGEIYEDVYASIDPIAENIRKLDDYAPYRLERLTSLRTLPEDSVEPNAKAMATDLLKANEAMVERLNAAFKAANDENEQGIANFLAERIDAHQKWCWFLRASTK